ncbi:MAG: 3-hydroxyacyl-ACP dehydratase FabZ [Pseudoclavibacter sp.]|nr:3-hydroxyacyl-ACP dehydratase FabZ [Pseudoclavibacter sp.]
MSGTGGTRSLEAAELLRLLPHRPPALLLDRVERLEPGVSVLAVKNVTASEPSLTGHFPGDPLLPGVAVLEALAQAGGLLFDADGRLCLLAGVDRARFLGPVRPGDRLLLHAEPIARAGRMAKAKARATTGERTVASAEISYVFVDGRPA